LPSTSYPWPRTWNPGDPDPFVFQSNVSSDLINYTGYSWPLSNHGEHFALYGGAKDHAGNYMFSTQHLYNLALTSEYWSYLTNGNLATLDELDNGTGTIYRFPHVANS